MQKAVINFKMPEPAPMPRPPHHIKLIHVGPQLPRLTDYGASILRWMSFWNITRDELIEASLLSPKQLEALLVGDVDHVSIKIVKMAYRGVLKIEKRLVEEGKAPGVVGKK